MKTIVKNYFFAALLLASIFACGAEKTKGGMVFNMDETQFFIELKYPATEQGVKNYIDNNFLVPGHDFTEFMINLNSRRACLPFKNYEAYWQGVKFSADGKKASYKGKELSAGEANMIARMKSLYQSGVDYGKVWIDRARSKGVSPWISVRMNDSHSAGDIDNYAHSTFYVRNYNKTVAPHREKSDWYQQLDYADKSVFEYQRNYIFELIDHYDLDGIELDFMRHGKVFKHGHEVENRHIMTDFVRQIYEYAQKKAQKTGKDIKIAVRVPTDHRDAWYLGFDVEEWCKRGYIHMVIPATFYQTTFSNIPIRDWRRIVGDNVLLAPCMEAAKTSAPNVWSFWDERIGYAYAASYLYQGADRIYFFNHFGRFGSNIIKSGRLDTVVDLPRRNMLSFTDFRAPGFSLGATLPQIVYPGSGRNSGEFRLECGPKPDAGRKVYAVFATRDNPSIPEMKVYINSYGPLKRVAVPQELSFEPHSKAQAAFEVPVSALNDGANLLEIIDIKSPTVINWCELYYTGK